MGCGGGSWVVLGYYGSGGGLVEFDIGSFFFFSFFFFLIVKVESSLLLHGEESIGSSDKRTDARKKKKKTNRIQIYNNRVNIRGYCRNFVYEQCYRPTDMGNF